MRQLITLQVNVPNLLQESIKEGMIGLEGIFIGKFVEWMESMLNQNSMCINQKGSPKMILVKSFGILLYRQTILQLPEGLTWFSLIRNHHQCQIIDFAISYDKRVDDKEVEKIEK